MKRHRKLIASVLVGLVGSGSLLVWYLHQAQPGTESQALGAWLGVIANVVMAAAAVSALWLWRRPELWKADREIGLEAYEAANQVSSTLDQLAIFGGLARSSLPREAMLRLLEETRDRLEPQVANLDRNRVRLASISRAEFRESGEDALALLAMQAHSMRLNLEIEISSLREDRPIDTEAMFTTYWSDFEKLTEFGQGVADWGRCWIHAATAATDHGQQMRKVRGAMLVAMKNTVQRTNQELATVDGEPAEDLSVPREEGEVGR